MSEKINADVVLPYTPQHTAGTNATTGCGIAYFMSAFCSFVQATSRLQLGQSDLAAAMGGMISTLNDRKDALLKVLNDNITSKINAMKDKHGDDLAIAQSELADLQSRYKLTDTQATSLISSLTPASQQDTDATTAIAQNNAQVFQIAMYMLSTLSTLVQLMKAA